MALTALTGVTVVKAPPLTNDHKAQERYFQNRPSSYFVSVRVSGHAQRVYVTPGAVDSSDILNSVSVAVGRPTATPGQRRAMVQVALGMFNVCWPSEGQPLEGFSRQLIAQP